MALFLKKMSEYIGRTTPVKVSWTALVIICTAIATIILFILAGDDEASKSIDAYTWLNFSPHTIMFIVIPVCIFEGSYKIDSHAFGHHTGIIACLATIVFLAAAGLTGVIVYGIENVYRGYGAADQWSIYACLLFGSIVSATDPVAVLTLLHDIGAPHDLSLVIEGESLLNDGVAIVMYRIFMLLTEQHVVKSNPLADPSDEPDLSNIGYIVLGVMASFAIGWAMAAACGYLFGVTEHNSVEERVVIVLAVYATYLACEAAKGSGVLGLVILGLKLDGNKEKLSEDGARDTLQTWDLLAFWANAIVFTITGVACAEFIWIHRAVAMDYKFMVMYFGLVLGVRFVVLLPLYFMSKFFPRLKYSYMMIWWGGLRGSVALLLAMQLRKVDFLDKETVRDRAVGYVSCCVLLSLSFQAILSPFVASKLGLDKVSQYRQRVMDRVLKNIMECPKRTTESLQHALPYFRETNWLEFRKFTTLHNPYDSEGKKPLRKSSRLKMEEIMAQDGTDPLGTSEDEHCHRVLVVVLTGIAKLKKQGILSNVSFQKLSHSLRACGDFRKFDVLKEKVNFSPSEKRLALYQKIQSCVSGWRVFLSGKYGKLVRKLFIEDSANPGFFWITWQILAPLISVGHVLSILRGRNVECDAANQLGDYDADVICYRETLTHEARKMIYLVLHVANFLMSMGRPVILHPASNKWKLFWRLDGLVWHILDAFCFVGAVFFLASKLVTVESCFDAMHLSAGPGIPPHISSSFCHSFLLSEYVLAVGLLRTIYAIYHLLMTLFHTLEASMISDIKSTMQCLYGLVYGLEGFERLLDNENHHLPEKFKTEVRENSATTRSKANLVLLQMVAKFPKVNIRMKTQTVSIMCLKEMNSMVTDRKRDGMLDDDETQALHTEIRQKVIDTLAENDPLDSLSAEDSLYLVQKGTARHEKANHRDGVMEDLIRSADKIKVPESAMIITEGQESKYVYYLLSGALAMQKKSWGEKKYVTIHPGYLLGAVAGHYKFLPTSSIIAITKCRLLRFNKEDFDAKIRKNQVFANSLVARFCFTQGLDYIRSLPHYKKASRPDLFYILLTEWETHTLEAGMVLDVKCYAKVVWLRGQLKMKWESGEENALDQTVEPFEVTCAKIENPSESPTFLMVQERGLKKVCSSGLEEM